MNRQDSFSRFFHSRSILMVPHHFSDIHAQVSPQQLARRVWDTPLPLSLRAVTKAVVDKSATKAPTDSEVLAQQFPHTWGQPFVNLQAYDDDAEFARHTPLRVGVVLSGGQAAGGHNVIAGIYDYVKQCNPQSQVIGFLNGPRGIFKHEYKSIDDTTMDQYRNMGGFDMICSGRDKIESDDQKEKAREICDKLDLHGLLIIGGDDSNTNGAVLAEYFKAKGCKTVVVGAPKTIDGDLKNDYIEQSFGFDTATKVYSELIGNLCVDVATSQDRYHFVRLMGRSASNIALECAMQTRANLTFIAEEVEAQSRSLMSLVMETCDMIIRRHDELNKDYGVILIPEGLIEFIPEFKVLIQELNDILATGENFANKLTPHSKQVFEELPEDIRHELLLERDSHGNVQVAKIATEKLLILMVQNELEKRHFQGKFIPSSYYFGYEGRCAMPSNFDAQYCYALGHSAGSLIDNGLSGYMAVVRHLAKPVDYWKPAGCPIIQMMNIERRKGKDVPVIKKYLVELEGPLFKSFAKVREEWKYKDLYRSPGPIQFEGACADVVTFALKHPTINDLLPDVPQSSCLFPKSVATMSPLQQERLRFRPPVAPILLNPKARAACAKKCLFQDAQQERFIRRAYPLTCDVHAMRAYAVEVHPDIGGSACAQDLTVGVVVIGQAVPGINNVICGLFERLQLIGGRLLGFKGIKGLLEDDAIHVEREDLDLYVNAGGCEMLGRTPSVRSLLRTDEGVAKAANSCRKRSLAGLVIIGGKFSLTDGAILAEHFLTQRLDTKVICVPANQENNVRHPLLEMAIGFDSASKTYSSLIGNMETDAASARKYWYFVRVMGNVTSHLVLEAALQCHPNYVVISERYVEENLQLHDVVRDIANIVARRSENGQNFGVLLIPEGLLTSLPQVRALLSEIDVVWASGNLEKRSELRERILEGEKADLSQYLSPWSASLVKHLPMFFREQLVKETPTGRLEVSELGIEQVLAAWVARELETRKVAGTYKGTFTPVCTYFGFQCRSTMPSNFDCALGIAHGHLASILIESGLTGMLTSVRGLCGRPQDWRMSAIPLQALMRVMPDAEERMYGRRVPIIPGSEVDLDGSAYQALCEGLEKWEIEDKYLNPGPIQFHGKTANHYNRTLFEEQFEYMVMLEELEALAGYVGGVCSFGVSRETLKTAVVSLQALADILTGMTKKKHMTSSGGTSSWDVFTQ